jgi:hypothetical protein
LFRPAPRRRKNDGQEPGRTLVIDNPHQVERLLDKLKASLPLIAAVTPAVAALIKERGLAIHPAGKYQVISVDYAGDEGGIVGKLQIGPSDAPKVLIVSLTHLLFDRRGPVGRQIAEYQKHRVKRLRQQNGPGGWMQ